MNLIITTDFDHCKAFLFVYYQGRSYLNTKLVDKCESENISKIQ